MIIGVPSEVKVDEYRVALTPAGVRELTSAGHTVYVEQGAGDGSSMPDADFVRIGAKIVDSAEEVWAAADLVCKVKEPVPEEFPLLGLRPDQTLFTYLHLAASRECTDALVGQHTSPARAHERSGREDGPVDGGPSPHAARWGQGSAGVRCAGSAFGARGDPRGRGGGDGGGVDGRRHALRSVHPRSQPRQAA